MHTMLLCSFPQMDLIDIQNTIIYILHLFFYCKYLDSMRSNDKWLIINGISNWLRHCISVLGESLLTLVQQSKTLHLSARGVTTDPGSAV